MPFSKDVIKCVKCNQEMVAPPDVLDLYSKALKHHWDASEECKRAVQSGIVSALSKGFFTSVICRECKGKAVFPKRMFHIVRVSLKAASMQSTGLMLAVLAQTIALPFTSPSPDKYALLAALWVGVIGLIILNAQISVFESYKEERIQTLKDREIGYRAFMESKISKFGLYEDRLYISPFQSACIEFANAGYLAPTSRFIKAVTIGMSLIPHWVWSLGSLEHEYTHSSCLEGWRIGVKMFFVKDRFTL